MSWWIWFKSRKKRDSMAKKGIVSGKRNLHEFSFVRTKSFQEIGASFND
jgi:hypothetical protein